MTRLRAIDLFAGWGGFTTGAGLAGVDVVWAANHKQIAVDVHAFNHRDTIHVCQDLHQADWSAVPRYDLLLASPACQGHSSAGQPVRRPHHDADRATAWAVVSCAEATRPRAIVVENVPRFRRWPLYATWCSALRVLGYHLTEQLVEATACGVPQRRTRLIVTGTRRPRPLELAPPATTEPAFGPCIEWQAPGWRPTSEASPDARDRFARGRRRCGPRFLSQHVTNHPGVPLDEPIRTITTKDQWTIVDGDRYRPLTLREYARAQSFADDYAWPAELPRADVVRGLGNAIPVLMAKAVVGAVADHLTARAA